MRRLGNARSEGEQVVLDGRKCLADDLFISYPFKKDGS
jgi:hypothetical protein